MRNAIIALMQDLYYDGAIARALLIGIGYRPAQIPEFRSAETFWPEVVLRLERGVVENGVYLMVAAAVQDFPGNERAKSLLRELGEAQEPAGARGPVRVLSLFADPVRGSKIRIDREARLLQEIAESGGIEVQERHAVRVTDIIRAILHEKPQILHFAGHGVQDGRLVFEGDSGGAAGVGPGVLAQAIIAASAEVLDCVVLNSCYTGGNAESFRGATRAVAGSAVAIRDDCALAFARGFYTGIRAGLTVDKAYETGRAEMGLRGCDTAEQCFVLFPADAK
jgi:CHAT domain-containing protein/effector-associated domain 1 (EAD1)-containing protein